MAMDKLLFYYSDNDTIFEIPCDGEGDGEHDDK